MRICRKIVMLQNSDAAQTGSCRKICAVTIRDVVAIYTVLAVLWGERKTNIRILSRSAQLKSI